MARKADMGKVRASQQRIPGPLAACQFVEHELHILTPGERILHTRRLAQGHQAGQRPLVLPQGLVAAQVLQVDGDESVRGPYLAPARAGCPRSAEPVRKQYHRVRPGALRKMDAHRHLALADGIDPCLVQNLELSARREAAIHEDGKRWQ